MILLYDFFFLVFSILYFPYLIIKGKAHAEFGQRFGFLPEPLRQHGKKVVWIHAVSVGEVMVAGNFVSRLKNALPEHVIAVSTTTTTGQHAAKRVFDDSVLIFYFPLDFSFIVRKVIHFLKPAIFIMFETEIWPNLITALHSVNVPVILVNGRISDKSYRRYRMIRWLFSKVLKKIGVFCMQTEKDSQRIRDLGAPPENVRVIGNMKYDVDVADEYVLEDIREQKRLLGFGDDQDVLVCGSTHGGEEEIVLKLYSEVLGTNKKLRLLIAPRHVDRVTEVEKVCRKMGFGALRVSDVNDKGVKGHQNEVLVLDTMGILNQMYRIGTVIFVGGSLVSRGGHNLIEPAMFRKPITFGPFMNNFQDMAEKFLKAGAAEMASDGDALKDIIVRLLSDEGKRAEMGRRAYDLVAQSKGAVSKGIEIIKSELENARYG